MAQDVPEERSLGRWRSFAFLLQGKGEWLRLAYNISGLLLQTPTVNAFGFYCPWCWASPLSYLKLDS